jgi:hypothetical protein
MNHRHTIGATASLAALTLCVWWLIHPATWHGAAAWYILMAAAWVLFAYAGWLVSRAPRKAAITLILCGAIGLPLAAGFAPPRTSDDLYRYIWDGRVQANGIDPYQYAPAASELAGLRDDFLWPAHSAWCVTSGCSLINRPAVHTIYPPVAQAYFRAVHAVSPSGAREGPIQLASTMAVVAVAILLIVFLPKVGADPRLAALWAWCPLIAIEAGNNAHLDVVSTFLAAAALLAAALAKTWRGTASGAALLGLAVATKITPALIGPSMLRRRPVTIVVVAALTVATVYLPHVIAAGPTVLGYLPDYLTAEGYETGTRFALLRLVLPTALALPVAAAILAATAALAFWRTDPDRPWRTAVVTTGVFLLIAAPGYSWYTILLVALAAMSDRPEWIAVAVAGYVGQYHSNLHLGGTVALQIGYGAAAAIVLAAHTLRLRPAWKAQTA